MTANAVIEAIENLPPNERTKVVSYLFDHRENPLPVVPADPASSRDAEFLAAADRVFTRHKKLFELLAQ